MASATAAMLLRRIPDIANDVQGVENVPHTFSSWDTCMTKAYCKWPAIIGIVVGVLTLLGILFCWAYGGAGAYGGYQPAPQQPFYEPPQFAQFDAGGRKPPVNEDALPPMPSWETAQKRKVLDEHAEAQEDVEMNPLNPAGVAAAEARPSQPSSPQAQPQRPALQQVPYGSGAYSESGYHQPTSPPPAHHELAAYPNQSSASGGYPSQAPPTGYTSHSPGLGYAGPNPSPGGNPSQSSPPGGYRAQPSAPYSSAPNGSHAYATAPAPAPAPGPAPAPYTAYSPYAGGQQTGVAPAPQRSPLQAGPPSAGRTHDAWTVV
ncbi:MAG: hypothetical protein M1838_000828 [Thelocarpon superellum]|nr:MAG: hypothetical protein M1838_000828 [Thelocarpon superellum]